MLSDLQPICLIGALVFAAIFLVAGIAKTREILSARSWLAATGRVTESKVRSKQDLGSDLNTFESAPLVVYEYTVGGENYRGTRINFAEKITGDDIAPILKKYPVGKVVPVYYDPSNPKQSVLERDLAVWLPLGVAAIILVLLSLGLGMPYVIDLAARGLAVLAPNALNVPMGTMLIGMGLFALWFAAAILYQVWLARGWQRTTARILDTGIQTRDEWDSDGQYAPLYSSEIVYSFETGDQQYISDRVGLGGKFRSAVNRGVSAGTKSTLQKYPVGASVPVYYNPKNPSDCALERGANGFWFGSIIALVLFGLAAWLLGVFQRSP